MQSSITQPRPRSERSAKTRDRVLDVATDLMARRGYSGTSISAISKAAGVLPASIYWHFESKEGLLGAVIERAADAWFHGAAEAMAQDEDAPEGEPSAGLTYLFEQQPEFFRVLLLISLERRDAGGPPLEAVQRVRERSRELLTSRLEDRVDTPDASVRRSVAERLADFGMVLLDGYFLKQQLDPAEGEALLERYRQIAWAMILAKEAFLAEANAPGKEGA